jgi:1-acyl-sn-glycerol-3-phosphate acyltransferase
MSNRFMAVARRLTGIPIKRMYNITTAGEKEAFALKPPYLLLSNHVNTLDPVILSIMHKRHIHWVAADTLFRNKYLRYALRRLVGSISKSKSRSDFYTIKQITKTVRSGGVVGMFPEGQRTWDGTTLPLSYATAKLVRMLKVPVVLCTLDGGYMSLPRWSDTRRRGKMIINYQKPLYPQDFAGMSTDGIYDLLTRRLKHDAYAYQREHMVVFKSSKRAEYLEHVLFICPSCGRLHTISSSGNSVTCSACGYLRELDRYHFFIPVSEGLQFATPADWNAWQSRELERRMASGEWDEGEPFFAGEPAHLFSGYRDERMKSMGEVRVNMSIEGIIITDDSEQRLYSFDHIDSLAIAMQRNLEFYHNKSMYRLKFPPPRASAFKYLTVFEALERVWGQQEAAT